MPNAEFTSPEMLAKQRPEDFPKSLPHEIWQQMSDRGKHLARFIKAPEGEHLNVRVEFDLDLGGSISQTFFDASEPAPLFAPCRKALLPMKRRDHTCSQS